MQENPIIKEAHMHNPLPLSRDEFAAFETAERALYAGDPGAWDGLLAWTDVLTIHESGQLRDMWDSAYSNAECSMEFADGEFKHEDLVAEVARRVALAQRVLAHGVVA